MFAESTQKINANKKVPTAQSRIETATRKRKAKVTKRARKELGRRLAMEQVEKAHNNHS